MVIWTGRQPLPFAVLGGKDRVPFGGAAEGNAMTHA